MPNTPDTRIFMKNIKIPFPLLHLVSRPVAVELVNRQAFGPLVRDTGDARESKPQREVRDWKYVREPRGKWSQFWAQNWVITRERGQTQSIAQNRP